MQKKLPLDLWIILAWTLMTLTAVLAPVLGGALASMISTFILALASFLTDSPVRVILGIPFVLFIPGYVLTAALFPKKDDLDPIERIALSFGLSIAVVPLIGLGLNFTPFGIRLVPILFTLCIYTGALVLIAAYRREQLPEEERFSVPFRGILEVIKNEINAPQTRTDRILTGVLLCSIVLAVGMLIYVIATPKTGERFTEFYILGPEGKAYNYTRNFTADAPAAILVGVVNHEYVPTNYTVQVALEQEVLTDARLTLYNNETWEENLSFVPQREGKHLKLEFWLFKEDNLTAPYQDLHLWVDVTRETPVGTPVLPTGRKMAVILDSRRGFIPYNQPAASARAMVIDLGDEIVWSNDGEVAVTLMSDIPGFGARLLDFNKRTSYVFTGPGTFSFYLKHNQELNSTVIVQPLS